MVRAGRYSVCVSSEPSILRCAGVVARMFSGAGMEAVSKRGVCLRTLVGVGLMMDGSREEVRLLVGLISFVLVRVTVMNLVLFWLSSTLNVYGERIVATWDRYQKFGRRKKSPPRFVQECSQDGQWRLTVLSGIVKDGCPRCHQDPK